MYKDRLNGSSRTQYLRNKKRIIESQCICGICGLPVDKTLRYPNPMAPSVDHIVPVVRGGHPFDMDNLQLAHWRCNRLKSDKLMEPIKEAKVSNRSLPLSRDWRAYRSDE